MTNPKLKQEKALKNLSELLGLDLEMPEEKTEDLLWQAQSALNYFKAKGEGFTYKECKQCGETFAYAYSFEGVGYCSIRCAKLSLQAIGIEWQPGKPLAERWGRYIPAVVSPQVLELLEEQIPCAPVDQQSEAEFES